MPLRKDMRPALEIVHDPENGQQAERLDRLAGWTWRLVYPSGLEIDEQDTDLPIWDQPEGARALAVIDPSGAPRAAIDLQPYGTQHQPVFYRHHHVGVSIDFNAEWDERHDDSTLRRMSATVYGRAKMPDDGFTASTGKLWAVVGGRFGECPQEDIDEVAVCQCLKVAVGVRA